jgi:polyisoprenoid-binding protein YceI
VASEGSELMANARSNVHPMTYRAPIRGSLEASVRDGRFDVDAPVTASLEVDLDDLHGDDPKTDREMRRRIDVQRYPRARAVVEHVSSDGGDLYRLSGELTIRGKTQPLEGNATVTLDGDRLHATGAVTIDIRDYGIKPPSLLLLRVHPEVEITIDLTADLSP